MNCDDVSLLLARERPPDDSEAELLDEHVAGCDKCSALVVGGADDPTWLSSPPADPASFEVGDEIAIGGMGRITRAFDRRLGRDVAIKEVLSFDQRARFEREAVITARLQHPAIVPIYEAGTWPDGRAFYTMRLVSGGTLADAIARSTTLAQRLALLPHVIAVIDALAYAHSRGVIHRDLKPQNILIGEFGETVVIDWGLAKERDRDIPAATDAHMITPNLTQAGLVLGTPCFLPPEQARGEELDERADVFALGAILYNVVTGAPPYWDRTHDTKELIAAVLAGPPTPVGSLAPGAPPDILAIIERALARDRDARFANASHLADELRRFQAGQLLASREYGIRDLLARWIRRHRTVVTTATVAFVVLAVFGVVALVRITRAERSEREQRTLAEKAYEVGESRGQRKLCETAGPNLTTPWDSESRETVRRKFERLKLPYVAQTFERVDATFAAWDRQLVAARDQICDTTRTVPRTQFAATLGCLEDRVREARALVSTLIEVDASIVLNAVTAAQQLTPFSICVRQESVRTEPPASAAYDEVRAAFARTYVLGLLGKPKEVLPLAQKTVVTADAIGEPGLRASARVVLGAAQLNTSDLDGAQKTLSDAVRLAEEGHDDRARAQAMVNLVRLELTRGRYEVVVAMQTAALGAAERIDDVFLATEIMLFVGGAYSQLGKFDDAQRLFQLAVDQRTKTFGERDRRTASAQSALGNAFAMKGALDEGIAAHRAAAVTAEAALGATHPTVGVMHGNLASDYLYGLRPVEAITEANIFLANAEAAYGPNHRDVALALTALGGAQLEAGQPAEALATFVRAETTWRAVNAKHPVLGDALLGKYLAQRALKQATSVADLEAALELGKGLPPFQRARIQFELGKVVPAARAIELVKASTVGFATSTLPLVAREQAAARAWLAARNVKL